MSRITTILLILASLLVVTVSAIVYWPHVDESAQPGRVAATAPAAISAAQPPELPPANTAAARAAPPATPPSPAVVPSAPVFVPSPAARQANAALPALVAEMRDAILVAARSGRLEELLVPIQWNELKPDFGEMRSDDHIAHLRAVSADGKGLEILATLASLLEAAPAVTRQGRDIENNRMFVWPDIAEHPLAKIDAEQRQTLDRLVGAAAAEEMVKAGRYRGWRLAIGADGVWHSFRKVE